MVLTEFVVLNLKDGVTVETLSSSASYKKACDLVRSQPGCQAFSTGLAVEDPKKLLWFLEWDNYAAHEVFINKKDIYDPFVQDLVALTNTSHPDGPLTMNHYPLDPPVSTLVTAATPTLECFGVTTKPDTTSETQTSVFAGFQENITKGGVPVTTGSAQEDYHKQLNLLAWESPEAHEAFKAKAGASFGPLMAPIVAIWEDKWMMHVRPVPWK